MKRVKEYIELYTDYLISQHGYATATGLSEMMDHSISHDQITRFLNRNTFDSKALWTYVKPKIREIEEEEGCLIFDDTIEAKPWTDESEIVCWHFDHAKGRSVKGINLLSALYHAGGVNIPVDYRVIRKPRTFCDLKTRKVKRKSEVSKNELMREMFLQAIVNQLKFRFVLLDSWFASNKNFKFIDKKRKTFIAALKSNRLFAPSLDAKKEGRFVSIDRLGLSDKESVRGYLKGYDKEIVLVCQIFTNKDGSTGRLYLVSNDTTLETDALATIYQKRWKVEEYHKSLKSNVALEKSPTKKITTQSNHVFLAILAFFKLELLKIKTKLNHFALRAKLLIKANQVSFMELQRLKGA